MKVPIQFQFTVPQGAQVQVVDDDHPALTRCPIVIGSRDVTDIEAIARKFWDYRIWHTLQETGSRTDVMPAANHGRVAEAIRELYWFNESDPKFLNGVDSVTVMYPKIHSINVRKQTAELPPHLPLVSDFSSRDNAKSIHIETENGTKCLAVFEQILDIEVPNPAVFLSLNSPSDPAWAMYISERGPMHLADPVTVLNDQQLSERHAWERVYSWCHRVGIPVFGEQYPNGEYGFPDYGASIAGKHYQVEMTTTPDMGKWTIKASYRHLEKMIREVARQPSETLAEVSAHISRVIAQKSKRVRKDKQVSGACPTDHYMLVLTNFSTHDLDPASIGDANDFSEFDAVLLIQSDEVHNVKWADDRYVLQPK